MTTMFFTPRQVTQHDPLAFPAAARPGGFDAVLVAPPCSEDGAVCPARSTFGVPSV
jgi:16S rRNA C967 or C1407 C5-methylase (RsmB/RsmF family)